MATWMVHLRIADGIRKRIPFLERLEFLMGNIAPDSGVPNEGWSVYTPDKSISHFKTDGNIDISLFMDKYMKKELWNNYTEKEKAFFLGYYVHLLTDVLWKKNIVAPSVSRFTELFQKNNEGAWKLKEDWYDLDHLFLKKNPCFGAFLEYENAVGFTNIFMEEFAPDAFDNRREHISGFYREAHGNLEREYPYLKETDMELFVGNTIEQLTKRLIEEKWLSFDAAVPL